MQTYKEVGIKAGLRDNQFNLYVDYMNKRWKDSETQKCMDGYAQEWAERFKNNSEWECSDIEGQLVLKELMGK